VAARCCCSSRYRQSSSESLQAAGLDLLVGRLGARNWLRLTGVKVNVSGREHLDPNQPYVFVANHQSYLTRFPCSRHGPSGGALAKKGF
jgi:hypothetical protein